MYLLRLEWLKIRSYRLFQVISILFMLLLPLCFLIGKMMGDLPKIFGDINDFYMFPRVWSGLGYAANWLSFICFGFLGVLLFTNEVSYRTLRQNVITGISRRDFLVSKVLMIFAISVAATLYYIACALFIGYTNTAYVFASRVTEGGDYALRFLLQCFGYMSIAFLFGVLTRRSGSGIFLYFIYGLFGERIIRYFLHSYILGKKLGISYINAIHYYPINALSDLLPAPVSNMTKMTTDNNMQLYLSFTEATVCSVIFIILAYAISALVLNKRDL